MATYKKLLEVREVLKNIPQKVVNKVTPLWELEQNCGDVDFGTEFALISKETGVPVDHLDRYYDWYARSPVRKIVIFAKAVDWHENKPCIGSRCDKQFLPRGTWVIGFVTERGCLIDQPFLENNQKDGLLAEIQQALIDFGQFEYTAEEILSEHQGAVLFE